MESRFNNKKKTFLKNEGMKLLESFLQMQPYWVCKENSMSPYFSSNCWKLSLESKKSFETSKPDFQLLKIGLISIKTNIWLNFEN